MRKTCFGSFQHQFGISIITLRSELRIFCTIHGWKEDSKSYNFRVLTIFKFSHLDGEKQLRSDCLCTVAGMCVCVFLSCGPYTWPIIQKPKPSLFAIISSHGPPSPLAHPPFLFLLTTPSNLIPFLSLSSTSFLFLLTTQSNLIPFQSLL